MFSTADMRAARAGLLDSGAWLLSSTCCSRLAMPGGWGVAAETTSSSPCTVGAAR